VKQRASQNGNRRKTGFKIISIVLALLLWFYVVNEGSYGAGQNVVTVDLLYENIPEGIQVVGPQQVQVKLWGVFQETEDIKPYVDLEGKTPGSYTLPVKLGAVMGALFTSVEPKSINVTLQATQELIVPVRYKILAEPPAGYTLIDLITEPEQCLIRGEQEMTKQVNAVLCSVDLSTTRSISSLELKVTPLDQKGQAITQGLEVFPDKIKVIAVVAEQKGFKEVPLKIQSEGEPGAGYQLVSIQLQPATVQIAGSQGDIAGIREINTPVININELDQSLTQQLDLEAPSGTTLYPAQVLAIIEIEAITENEEEL
jgi:YbbR domain-containing protein